MGELLSTSIILAPKSHSQDIRCLAKPRRTADHLSGPHISQEPADMSDRASRQITRGSAPGAVEYPSEADKGEGQVGSCDCDQAEERDGRGGVSS